MKDESNLSSAAFTRELNV